MLKALLVIAAIFFGLLSCNKENQETPDKPHSAVIYLTDHATPVFDSVFIDIQRLEVKLDGDTLSNGGWINMAIRPGVYNILRFRNGLDTLFATGTLPNSRLKKIKMVLGRQNRVMKAGQSFALQVKDNDREVIATLDSGNFEVTANGAVMFWIDFDAGNSIQVDNSGSGNNNGYRLKSHIRIFTRSRSGRIEGRVLPRAADPIVKAIMGTDTATAVPDFDDGDFKIVGLNAGTYQLLIDGQNGYLDTLIQNVTVQMNEDTRIPVITLRR